MSYAYPVGDIYVSADWANHRGRTPPSSEPGTDYAAAYGSSVAAPGAGTVTDLKTTSSGAMGRYVRVSLDDGRTARGLHMSQVGVVLGQRVGKGQYIGESGASGYGSDWYYGSHLHQTLWPHGAFANPTIDFELYVGGSEPTPPPPDDEEDDMALRMMHWTGGSASSPDTVSKLRRAIWSETSGLFTEWTESGSTYANNMARNWDTGSSAELTQSLAHAIYQSCLKVRPQPE